MKYKIAGPIERADSIKVSEDLAREIKRCGLKWFVKYYRNNELFGRMFKTRADAKDWIDKNGK